MFNKVSTGKERFHILLPHIRPKGLNAGTPDKKQKSQTYRIAIFEPAIHPAIDEISQGFIDTLGQSKDQYQCKKYNANGNKILMRAQAEEIIQGNFDLIFTIGAGCSLMIKELCAKKQSTTPLVFCAVDDPQRLQLTGNTITGIAERTDYPKQLKLLKLVKPSIRSLLLVYDPSQGSGFERDKQEITALTLQHGMTLRVVEIQHIAEIQQKVSGFMDTVDAVMILKDHTTVSGIDSLITLCQRHHIPLLASDLNSGDKGAALAFGIREYDSGSTSAQIVRSILEEKKEPSVIPVASVEKMQMIISRKQTELQGIVIDPLVLERYKTDIRVLP